MVTKTKHNGPVTRIGELGEARASFARRSWGDAHQKFARADAAKPLDLDDLEKLAYAAYLTGLEEESTVAWTRAHHEAIRCNDPLRARPERLSGRGGSARHEGHGVVVEGIGTLNRWAVA